MFRFPLYVSMAFATAFVGVFWAARGFPMHSQRVEIVHPLPATLNTTFGDDTFEREYKKQRQIAVQEQMQSPENAERDRLRLATLQAANAYALSPCGPGFKDELVKTLTAYARAYMDMRDCTYIMCSDKKVELAEAAFDSPLDQRVQAALKEAFDQGGITVKEFPSSLYIGVLNFAQGQGSHASRCMINQHG
jgi:hypothetical protein